MSDTPSAQRPLPSLKEVDTAEFWRATQQEQFRYQVCQRCQTVVWFPRAHCTGCTRGQLTWHTSAGNGTIYSFSIVRQSYHPFFRHLVPYAVAYVDLDEGLRFLTNVVGVDAAQVRIGQRVQLVWEAHPELKLPLVTPVEPGQARG